MTTQGTKEWASSNVNLYYGCSHNCSYCYAMRLALRFGRIDSKEEWKVMKPNQKAIDKGYGKRKGRIMFPTSHDITPEVLDNCILVLKKMLKARNEVLITTKPWLECIVRICKELREYRPWIQFRFTITSNSNKLYEKHEPGAPMLSERTLSLEHAYDQGFKTSVSIEPFLDKDPVPLIKRISGWVTETIWLGIMSGFRYEHHTKANVGLIVKKIKELPLSIVSKIRLKDSIRFWGFEM